MAPHARSSGPRRDPDGSRSTWVGLALIAVLTAISAVGVAVAVVTREDADEAAARVQESFEAWAGAVEDRDCDAYEAVTTRDFRRQAEDGGDYDCQTWREAESGAATWTDIVLEDVVEVRGDQAMIVVGATYVYEYAEDDFVDTDDIRADIVLHEQDGEWVLAEVELQER